MKACKTCGETKPLDEFWKRSDRAGGYFLNCKPCQKAIYALQPKKAKQAARVAHKKATFDAVAADKAAKARYRESSKGREAQARERQRAVEAVSDRYVRRLLAAQLGVSYGQAPDELVQLKRDEIALRRMARLLKEASNAKQQNG